MSEPPIIIDQQRRPGRFDWQRYVFPGIWLIYLGQTLGGIAKHSSGAAAIAGYLMLAAFCVAYLATLPTSWTGNRRQFWVGLAVMFALCAAESPIAHEDAFVMCVFVAVVLVAGLGKRAALPVAVLTVVTMFVPPLVPSWHAGADYTSLFTLPLVAMAMWAFFGVIHSNIELARARSEVARLAAENERSRIARDLHDLLGHSLTTITVKAGLARRLFDRDPQRAAVEIGEVEQLTRSALADVRAAVSGYRDLSLAGELASARAVLRAAGIDADLPGAIDVVDPALHELFGWVAREGITNVVRHSRAHHCTVTVGRDWIEIVDDGQGGTGGCGNGLRGLRERVEAAGGTVSAGPGEPGWRLRADVRATVPAPV